MCVGAAGILGHCSKDTSSLQYLKNREANSAVVGGPRDLNPLWLPALQLEGARNLTRKTGWRRWTVSNLLLSISNSTKEQKLNEISSQLTIRCLKAIQAATASIGNESMNRKLIRWVVWLFLWCDWTHCDSLCSSLGSCRCLQWHGYR